MEKTELEIKEADYKVKYDVIAKVENTDSKGNPIVCYFKSPSRLVLGIAMAEIDRNTLLACEYIFDDAVVKEISNHEEFRGNDALFLGITGVLQSLVRVKKSTYTSL
jgi:hypothetical protein